MDRAEFNSLNVAESRSVNTFYGLIDLPVPVPKSLALCVTLWSHNFIGNDLRDFSFKCRFNYLSLNNRHAAYDPDANPSCTFCRIGDPNTGTRESFEHLFFVCPVSGSLIDNLLTMCFNVNIGNVHDKKRFVWSGELDTAKDLQFILLFFWESVRYTIYRYKSRNRIPNHFMIRSEVFFIIKSNLYNKEIYRLKINSSEALANWLPALG
jgi:hypothetical protein